MSYKNLALMCVSLLVAISASAGTVTIPAGCIGGTNVMVLAPVIAPSASGLASFTERTATNAVKVGEIRRQGSTLIAVAIAGTTSTSMTTTTNVFGNITNVVVAATPITVPASGLSAADGTVYWMRVPRERNNVILKTTIGDGTVTLSTSDGGSIPVTSTTVFDTEFKALTKALFATQSTSTNVNSVSTLEW